jgi:hypothetical protein
MDGQMEWVNQILEDILRAYVIEYQGSWDNNLPCAAFSYNNSYQESLKMAPFEVLYGRRCRTLLNWIEPREKLIFGPGIVEEAEMTVHRLHESLKAVKSRQETYANKRRRPLSFEVCDHVYLRVLPMKGMKRFGVKGKLVPRYIGPFPILLSFSSRHHPHVATKEMFQGTYGHCVAGSDTARDWLVVPWAPNQGLGSEGSCHEA